MPKKYTYRLLALFAVFTFSLLTGCAPKMEEAAKEQPRITWPPPPHTARIAYVKTIAKPEDIGANSGFFDKLLIVLLGRDEDDIVKPYGLTLDSRGRVIVVDTNFKRIHVFDAQKNKYLFIDEHGDERPFVSPIAAAVDSNDNIYVSDSSLSRVFVYSPALKYLRTIEGFARPTGLAVDKKTNRLFVVDTAMHQVKVFEPSGALAFTFGERGDGNGSFNFPVDIFIGPNGNAYITDTMNYKIQVFGTDGKFISQFGAHGDGSGDFGRPKGVAVDASGHVYVADAIFDTVQIFNNKGEFLLNFGSLGAEAGRFWMPCGVYVDGKTIYVADSFNRRIQVFEYLGG